MHPVNNSNKCLNAIREVLCEILAQKEEVYINILDVIPLLPLPGDILAR